jgi:GNAT superfamily N-acetyltransferase
MPIAIRDSRPGDSLALQQIERVAGLRFREVGLGSVADAEPASIEELTAYALAGRSWAAVDQEDNPVGYVIVDVVDGNAHIEQISVRPDRQGTGIGRALVDRVRTWATDGGRSAVTLTTFARVPWNAPLYAHLGFVILREDEIRAELRAVRDAETRHGLDPSLRVCMRLELES